MYMTSSELSYFDLKIWKHDHPVLATSMLGRVDVLCYLIHASVAFCSAIHTWNDLNLIKLLELFLKWIEKEPGGIACRTDRAFETAHFALVRTRARLCMTEASALSFWLPLA